MHSECTKMFSNLWRIRLAVLKNQFLRTFGSKYSRMDQVKFVEYSLKRFIWCILKYLDPLALSVFDIIILFMISPLKTNNFFIFIRNNWKKLSETFAAAFVSVTTISNKNNCLKHIIKEKEKICSSIHIWACNKKLFWRTNLENLTASKRWY